MSTSQPAQNEQDAKMKKELEQGIVADEPRTYKGGNRLNYQVIE